ncbi:MAG: AEC family transporter [Marinicaulis sp.]|nr:AEC family transporter [Marinicaulis sp.]
MSAVFSVALPVFGIIAAGIFAGRFQFLTIEDSQSLNKFVFRFAMPAALFGLTAGSAPPGPEAAPFVGSYAIAAAIVLFAAYHLSKKLFALTGQEAGAHSLASVMGNAVFLGLPIALSIEGWGKPFVMLMLIEGVFVIGAGAAMLASRDNASGGAFVGYFVKPLKNPLVAGMALGFLYSVIGLGFSGPVETFFSLLGRAAGPTALFSLGLFLATHKFPDMKVVGGRVSFIAIGKMFALPAIALGLAAFFGVSDPHYLGALALFMFVPSGVTTFVMASQAGAGETETAAAVFATTLLSVLTISGVLIAFA